MSESNDNVTPNLVHAPPTAPGVIPSAARSADHPPTPIPDRLNPWMSIWMHPKRTMRWILEHRTPKQSMSIMFIASYLTMVDWMADRDRGDELTLTTIFATSMFLALVHFAATYYLFGWLLHRISAALMGRATLAQTRTALCWMSLFTILTAAVNLGGGMLIFGRAYFSSIKWDMGDADPSIMVAYLATLGLSFLIMIPGFVLSVAMLAEAHRFAWWRSLLALIITGAIAAAVFFITLILYFVGN